MIKIGLFGGYASGKSTCLKYLHDKGVPCICLDNVLVKHYKDILFSSATIKEKIDILKPKILKELKKSEDKLTVGVIEMPVGVLKEDYRSCREYFDELVYIHTEPVIRKTRLSEEKQLVLERLSSREVDLEFAKKNCDHLIFNNANQVVFLDNIKALMSKIHPTK